jgi:hypothetical protein
VLVCWVPREWAVQLDQHAPLFFFFAHAPPARPCMGGVGCVYEGAHRRAVSTRFVVLLCSHAAPARPCMGGVGCACARARAPRAVWNKRRRAPKMRSGRTVLRLQSIPTSKRTNELLRRRKRGRRVGDGGSEGGGRVRAGGRARGSAEDGAVPLTGRRCRCRARRGWCRAWCGGGLRGMPLLRIQGRLPRRVPAERAHPQRGMIRKLCY